MTAITNNLKRIHQRLLPSSPWIGWTPYLWLVYLGFFYIKFFFVIPPWTEWLAAGLATALFLYLYFTGYWREGRALLFNIAGIAAIGAVMAPINTGAGVFFIYAGSFAPFVGSVRTTAALIGGLLGVIAIESLLFGLPPSFWIPAGIITPLIALANYHFVSMARKEVALRRSEEEVKRLAQVAERERIARDLHDLLGHTLSVIALKTELAGKLLERDNNRARSEIEDVERISRQALAEVREAVTGYRRHNFNTETERARQALASAGIESDVDFNGVVPPPSLEPALAFALREATTNVIRHSGASRCRFELNQNDTAMSLHINDDGKGGNFNEGSGLKGMRERVRSLGGKLNISTDRGTLLTITLPLQQDALCSGC